MSGIGAFVFELHAVWRWVLLIASVTVVIKALIGWSGKQPWSQLDDRLGMVFTMVVDIQFLIGLILWFIGPFNFTQLSRAMSTPLLRFYLLEHPIFMLIALALAHVGRSRSRKAATAEAKHKAAFVFYLLSFLFIVLIFILRVTIR